MEPDEALCQVGFTNYTTTCSWWKTTRLSTRCFTYLPEGIEDGTNATCRMQSLQPLNTPAADGLSGQTMGLLPVPQGQSQHSGSSAPHAEFAALQQQQSASRHDDEAHQPAVSPFWSTGRWARIRPVAPRTRLPASRMPAAWPVRIGHRLATRRSATRLLTLPCRSWPAPSCMHLR